MIVTIAAEAGAVYIVVASLAVPVGLNVPQLPTGVQLQFTPAVSFATVAATSAVLLFAIVRGGNWLIATVIGCGGIVVMLALQWVRPTIAITTMAADRALVFMAARPSELPPGSRRCPLCLAAETHSRFESYKRDPPPSP